MKTGLLSLVILSAILHNIHTQEMLGGDFEFKLNYGSFGWGMNIFSNEHNFELSASLLDIFVEHNKTNIGLEINPLKYIANYPINAQEWNQSLYFLNGNLYWNPFDIENIILGPFVSINYLSIKNWEAFSASEY
ncbi:MAG: hypothetical protein LBI91_05135, partial [Spirochaetaceae bacterium]|nr:hypothetical protein [Spirochaetaceae bacterium]